MFDGIKLVKYAWRRLGAVVIEKAHKYLDKALNKDLAGDDNGGLRIRLIGGKGLESISRCLGFLNAANLSQGAKLLT